MAMTRNVEELRNFYASPLGHITAQLITQQLAPLIGSLKDARVAGLGFTTPFMHPHIAQCERMIAFMPQRQGAISWPDKAKVNTCLVDPFELPVADASLDCILAVHALEFSADAEELMRELWRVCAPGARLTVIVPNRRGVWARRDGTPFGHGNPFSHRQLSNLLLKHSFVPQEWGGALFIPPSRRVTILKSARLIENLGRAFTPGFAGVHMVTAFKQQYPAVARRKPSLREVLAPIRTPAPALPTSSGFER